MSGLGIDLEFECFEDPPNVFITWNGVQEIKIYEEPIYIGGELEDESSWEPGPLAKLLYALITSELISFGEVVEAQAIREIPHNNISVPESVRIRLERDYLPSQLPPIRYDLSTNRESASSDDD